MENLIKLDDFWGENPLFLETPVPGFPGQWSWSFLVPTNPRNPQGIFRETPEKPCVFVRRINRSLKNKSSLNGRFIQKKLD